MKSTTDRDLIMRYLEYTEHQRKIKTHFIDKALVHHFADSNRDRVTNNLKAKHEGLNLFYRKYYPRFDYALQKQSLQIAHDRFGFKFPSQLAKVSIGNLNTESTHIAYPKQTQPINPIISFACFDIENCKGLLDSLMSLNPNNRRCIANLHVCLVTSNTLKDSMQEIIQAFALQTHIKTIKNTTTRQNPPISLTRTTLQHFTLEIGQRFFDNDFVSWIIDDDLRFHGFDGSKNYPIDYFSHIASHVHSGIDCLLAQVSGEPPIPFVSMLRGQLLDLYFSLQPSSLAENEKAGEYYYDLSSSDFHYLEYPFLGFSPEIILNNFKNRCNTTRNIIFSQEQIGTLQGESIYRGGNTIIYNPELLYLSNFTPDEEQYNRRSDFNWAIAHSILGGKNIRAIVLPLFHARKKTENHTEIKKIEADLIGMIFYRVFKTMCELCVQHKKLEYSEVQHIFNIKLKELKTKLVANIYRIQTLEMLITKIVDQTPLQQSYAECSRDIQSYAISLKAFCQAKQELCKKAYDQSEQYIYQYAHNKNLFTLD
ncbi:MAG: hypothetical protein MR025_07850 [Helicobacter trogontum]|nr:hypothetical protein [Helicobacter trogontum]